MNIEEIRNLSDEEKIKLIQNLSNLEEEYRFVSRALKRIEKTFKIIIDDNEMATLLKILKRL